MKQFGGLFAIAPLLFAAFSSSSSYQLQSYGINGAASNNAASASYQLESSTGQVQSVSSSSTTLTNKSGSLEAQQANVPPAPSLSNGSGTFYNKLGLIINIGGNATDATYVVAISSNGFSTTSYVQADGSLGGSPLFQSYVQWGGASGTTIIGLANATTYQVKVSAMQGKFTQSAYGPVASATTASPSLSFSVSPGTLTLPNLLSATIETGSSITATLATNAGYGGSIYAADTNSGLKTTSHSFTIPSVSINLSGTSHGYGLRGTGTSQTSGGPLSILSPFNGASGIVGGLSTQPQVVFSASTPLVGGSTTAVLQAKAAATDPAAADYSDTLTFTAAASF